MPSARLDKQNFPFFDSVKNPVTAVGISDSYHNVGFDTLILEVAGSEDIELKVQGCSNILKEDGMTSKSDDECEWSDLAVINAKNFDVSESISSNGIYYIGINGLMRVRVSVTSITGSATILGTMEA